MSAEQPPERPAETSPDLPYQLQFQSFQQVTNISTGGVGLTITLASAVLKTITIGVWMAVLFFALSILVALSGQIQLADRLFKLEPSWKRSRMSLRFSTLLLGMGVGGLGATLILR